MKKRVISVLLAAVIVFGFTACKLNNSSGGTTAANTSPGSQTASFRITGPDGDILARTETDIAGLEKVADGLKVVCAANGIEIKTSGSGMFAYIRSIGGFEEFGRGALSGWVYAKNNVYSSVGAGSALLEPGDFIWFYYTADLGADFQGILSANGD